MDPPADSTLPGAKEADDAGGSVELCIHKMDGEEFRLSVRPSDRISDVITRLSEQSGIETYRLQLAQGPQKLRASATVEESNIQIDVPLLILVGGHCPEYARALGLSCEHPMLLREWFSKHELEQPDWLESDEAVWQKLREELRARERRKIDLEMWETHANLSLPTGEPANLLRARPGETVHCHAKVWTHNRDGDCCIQQGLLAMGTTLAEELCNTVPGEGEELSKDLEFEAPAEPGAYMLWTHVGLEYEMEDARRKFLAACKESHAQAYPKRFVGWIIVEEAAA